MTRQKSHIFEFPSGKALIGLRNTARGWRASRLPRVGTPVGNNPTPRNSPVRDDKIVARQFSAGWAPARGKSHRDGRTGRKNDFFAKPSWLADYCAKKADITLPKSFAVRAPDDYFPSARMEARNWVSCSLSPASCWRASLVVILPERSASDSFMTVFMNSGE